MSTSFKNDLHMQMWMIRPTMRRSQIWATLVSDRLYINCNGAAPRGPKYIFHLTWYCLEQLCAWSFPNCGLGYLFPIHRRSLMAWGLMVFLFFYIFSQYTCIFLFIWCMHLKFAKTLSKWLQIFFHACRPKQWPHKKSYIFWSVLVIMSLFYSKQGPCSYVKI
jgi:hypothetical protein